MMAKKRLPPQQPPPFPRWVGPALAVVAAFCHLAVLPGALSSFRIAKDVALLGGFALVCGLALALSLWRGRLLVAWQPLALAISGYLLAQVVCVWSSASFFWSLPSLATTCLWLAAIWVLSLLEQQDRSRINRWCAVGALLSAAVLLLQAVGIELLPMQPLGAGRFVLTGLTGNPADLSIAAVLLIPLLLKDHERTEAKRWWILPVLLAIAAVLTQTIAAILSIIAIVIIWILHRYGFSVKHWVVLAVIAVVVAGSFTTTSRFRFALKSLQEHNWYMVFSARSDSWQAAAQMMRDHPLFGIGPGCFSHSYYPSRLLWLERHNLKSPGRGFATHFETAHCDPLQVGAEMGVVGGIWMLLLILILLRRHRKDSLLLLSAAAATPLLLFHYPSHIAVGMLPMALVLGQLLSQGPLVPLAQGSKVSRRCIAVGVLCLAVWCLLWQARRASSTLWQGRAQRVAEAAMAQQSPQIALTLRALESRANADITHRPEEAAWLWRLIGRCRLAQRDARGAESAFRTSFALWPHEETELGLGLALERQGRRLEALQHLSRVCRTNASLLSSLHDPELRRLVEELIELKVGRP